MHVKAHSPSQQTLSATPQHGPVVVAMTAQMLVHSAEQRVPTSSSVPELKKDHKAGRKPTRVLKMLAASKSDEGPYERLALRASQSEQRFPPTSACYEVADRSMPSVSSF